MPGYYWFNHLLVLVDTPPRRGRLVEDQDGRILQDRAGDGDPLALAAGELGAPFADDGVQAIRHLFDELHGVSGAGRGHDRLTGCIGGSAVGDVRRHGVVEQDDVLADERHVGAQ